MQFYLPTAAHNKTEVLRIIHYLMSQFNNKQHPLDRSTIKFKNNGIFY
jgi:hypothetical protein